MQHVNSEVMDEELTNLFENFLSQEWPYDDIGLIDKHGGRPCFTGIVSPNQPIKMQVFDKKEPPKGKLTNAKQ